MRSLQNPIDWGKVGLESLRNCPVCHLAIAVAMPQELWHCLPLLEEYEELRLGRMRVALAVQQGAVVVLYECGIGKVNSAINTQRIIDIFHPEQILNVGVCGALAPSLRVGDLVQGVEFAYHDVWCGEGNAFGQVQGLPPRFNAEGLLSDYLRESDYAIRAGLMCTGEYFVPESVEVERIRRNFPEVLTVDMESAAIAQTCHMLGTNFTALRVVSDTPGREADHQRQYREFWADSAEERFSQIVEILFNYLEDRNPEQWTK